MNPPGWVKGADFEPSLPQTPSLSSLREAMTLQRPSPFRKLHCASRHPPASRNARFLIISSLRLPPLYILLSEKQRNETSFALSALPVIHHPPIRANLALPSLKLPPLYIKLSHPYKTSSASKRFPSSTSLPSGSTWHPPLPQTPSPIKIYTRKQNSLRCTSSSRHPPASN